MDQFKLLNTAGTIAMLAVVHPAAAQSQHEAQPVPPSAAAEQGGASMPGARTRDLQESMANDAYPTAVQCAQAQGQAQMRKGTQPTPRLRRILQQCERIGAGSDNPKSPPGQALH
jgi:hypothetical protein